MLCPKCKYFESKVLDSRPSQSNIRRRRQCDNCQFRFTTIEEIKIFDIYVVKRSGRKELFNEKKLEMGIRKSFNKRTIDDAKITVILQQVIEKILALDKNLLTSIEIGQITLNILEKIDEAAFVCYWAMFGNFETISDFEKLLSNYIINHELPSN
jgi:transcriptional repressor NrdR